MISAARVPLWLAVAALAGCCRPPCRPDPVPSDRSAPSAPAPSPASAPVRRPEVGKPIAIAGPGYEGAIFARGWAPSEEEVRRLEADLIGAAKKSSLAPLRPLEGYFRQYVGVVREDGRRRIRVHGLHRSYLARAHGDPRREEIQIDDGGDAFFEASYDPESGRFDYVQVHGEA